jgi:hypothetical protein
MVRPDGHDGAGSAGRKRRSRGVWWRFTRGIETLRYSNTD